MPGELSNPEMSIPYHYDPKYEPGTNTFDSRPLNIDQILQSVSRSIRGCPMTKEELSDAARFLNKRHMLNRNPGDQEVQEDIQDYVKSLAAARRVVRKSCQI